jgi:hypothetical protein
MQNSIAIIDDFLPEPVALRARAAALEAEYGPFYGPGGQTKGKVAVKRIALTLQPDLAAGVAQWLGRDIEPVWGGYRLDYHGERPNMAVHIDVECGSHGAILYLNLPHQCRGGTAFWRHRAADVDRLPPGASPELSNHLLSDGADEANWDLSSIVGMRWNRCLVYKTNMFHSRLPLTGFGDEPANGRLIAGIMFNCPGLPCGVAS